MSARLTSVLAVRRHRRAQSAARAAGRTGHVGLGSAGDGSHTPATQQLSPVMQDRPTLSIVIAALNEQDNVAPLIEQVRQALEEKHAAISSSEVQMVPNTTTALDPKTAAQALRLLDLLDELDDVQKVYSNAEFPDEVLAETAG